MPPGGEIRIKPPSWRAGPAAQAKAKGRGKAGGRPSTPHLLVHGRETDQGKAFLNNTDFGERAEAGPLEMVADEVAP
jgi:hypothetical protein